jgi:hypothetical protein
MNARSALRTLSPCSKRQGSGLECYSSRFRPPVGRSKRSDIPAFVHRRSWGSLAGLGDALAVPGWTWSTFPRPRRWALAKSVAQIHRGGIRYWVVAAEHERPLWSARTGGEGVGSGTTMRSPLGDPLTGWIWPPWPDPADDLHLEPQDPRHGGQHATSRPRVSTTTWRLMSSIFLAPSRLHRPRTDDDLIEQKSITSPALRPWPEGMAAPPWGGVGQAGAEALSG